MTLMVCTCLGVHVRQSKKGVPVNKGAMSTSRVAEADAMAVDEAGGVAPSREWMQAAQRALETQYQ